MDVGCRPYFERKSGLTMKSPYILSFLSVAAVCLGLSLPISAQDADAPAKEASKPKTSHFAPVKDTEAQLKYYIQKIGKDLADKSEYSEAQIKRVGLDASTVSVLAFTLAIHDKESKLKPAASKRRKKIIQSPELNHPYSHCQTGALTTTLERQTLTDDVG